MSCPRCGKYCSEEARFCGFCGYNLSVSNDSDYDTKPLAPPDLRLPPEEERTKRQA